MYMCLLWTAGALWVLKYFPGLRAMRIVSKIFTSTSGTGWTPRRYQENEPDPHRMTPKDIFVTTQDTDPFHDANQGDLSDYNQDLWSQLSPTIVQEFPKDL